MAEHELTTGAEDPWGGDRNLELFFWVALSTTGSQGTRVKEIQDVCARGADVEALSQDGSTPLTEAIAGGMGSPAAVRALLALGADPSRRDGNGWTPWGSCVGRLHDRVVADRMEKIRDALADAGADRSDEEPIRFERAVSESDLEAAKAGLEGGIDPNSPLIAPLTIAASNGDLAMVRLLLAHGALVDGPAGADRTCLMDAAESGHLDVCKCLVEHGASVTASCSEMEELTADILAEERGHIEVAAWLRSQLPAEILAERQAKIDRRNPKFAAIYERRTNGINFELTTDAIAEKLETWDALYGIRISNVEPDGLTVRFESLPDNLADLTEDIRTFCPTDDDDNPKAKASFEKGLRKTRKISLWWD